MCPSRLLLECRQHAESPAVSPLRQTKGRRLIPLALTRCKEQLLPSGENGSVDHDDGQTGNNS